MGSFRGPHNTPVESGLYNAIVILTLPLRASRPLNPVPVQKCLGRDTSLYPFQNMLFFPLPGTCFQLEKKKGGSESHPFG